MRLLRVSASLWVAGYKNCPTTFILDELLDFVRLLSLAKKRDQNDDTQSRPRGHCGCRPVIKAFIPFKRPEPTSIFRIVLGGMIFANPGPGLPQDSIERRARRS